MPHALRADAGELHIEIVEMCFRVYQTIVGIRHGAVFNHGNTDGTHAVAETVRGLHIKGNKSCHNNLFPSNFDTFIITDFTRLASAFSVPLFSLYLLSFLLAAPRNCLLPTLRHLSATYLLRKKEPCIRTAL